MEEFEERVMSELDCLIYFETSQKDVKVPIDPLLSEYFYIAEISFEDGIFLQRLST